MTSGPAEILLSRDHLWVRVTDGAAVFATTNTFLAGNLRKVDDGGPWA